MSNINFNPELKIIKLKYKDINFNVIQDGFLTGGTKQRMIAPIIKTSSCTEFVYAGPVYGYAQIALAYVAHLLGKKATLFLEKMEPRWQLTTKALEYKPKLIEMDRPIYLKKLQKEAEEYVKKVKAEKGDDYICYLSFGLYKAKDVLADQIKKALPESLKKTQPKTMWLVVGSGTVLGALYKVFPNTFFNVVQVGATVWPDQLDLSRTRLFISPQQFQHIAKYQPPYETMSTYDAKLWIFFTKYGQDGDYIWNVAKDVEPLNMKIKENKIEQFPYFKNWILRSEIIKIMSNIKNYNYENNLVYNINVLDKHDMHKKYIKDVKSLIINRKIDYYRYNILADIICERCIILDKRKSINVIDYYFQNKQKIMDDVKETYGEITPYFIRKSLIDKKLEYYPYNITNIATVISFLNIDSIFDIDPMYGECLITSFILNKKYNCLLKNGKCSEKMYKQMIFYLSRIMKTPVKNIFTQNHKYDAVFLRGSFDKKLDFINKSNKYIVQFTDNISDASNNLKHYKTFVFTGQSMRDFQFALIYKIT